MKKNVNGHAARLAWDFELTGTLYAGIECDDHSTVHMLVHVCIDYLRDVDIDANY